MNKITAILIDPINQVVREVEYDKDSGIEGIYELIDADRFEVVTINDEADGIYVDEEGLFNSRYFFEYRGYPQPLAGKGLILGCDENGESCEPSVSVAYIRAKISFPSFVVV